MVVTGVGVRGNWGPLKTGGRSWEFWGCPWEMKVEGCIRGGEALGGNKPPVGLKVGGLMGDVGGIYPGGVTQAGD